MKKFFTLKNTYKIDTEVFFPFQHQLIGWNFLGYIEKRYIFAYYLEMEYIKLNMKLSLTNCLIFQIIPSFHIDFIIDKFVLQIKLKLNSRRWENFIFFIPKYSSESGMY